MQAIKTVYISCSLNDRPTLQPVMCHMCISLDMYRQMEKRQWFFISTNVNECHRFRAEQLKSEHFMSAWVLFATYICRTCIVIITYKNLIAKPVRSEKKSRIEFNIWKLISFDFGPERHLCVCVCVVDVIFFTFLSHALTVTILHIAYPIMYQMSRNCDNKSLNKWMNNEFMFDVLCALWECLEKTVVRTPWHLNMFSEFSFLLFIFHVFLYSFRVRSAICVADTKKKRFFFYCTSCDIYC